MSDRENASITHDGSIRDGAIVGFGAACLIAVGTVLIADAATVGTVAGGICCIAGGFLGNAAFDLGGSK